MTYKLKYGNKEIQVPQLKDITWANVLNKPSLFPPSSHSHDWDSVTGKPSSYTPSNHNHLYSTWLGMNYVSGAEWFGFYNQIGGGTRLGWLGFDGSNYLKLTNTLARSSSSGIMLCAGDKAGVCLDFTNSTNYHGYFFPRYSSKVTLGTSGYRWYRLYASNTCDTSSDKNLKDNIFYFDEAPIMFGSNEDGNIYEQFFNKLRACSFTMKSDITNSLRFGFIAQDVLKALEDVGLSIDDVDFISYGMRDDEDDSDKPTYGLCYEEFISLNTYMIQKSIARINSQQKEIDDLKKQVYELKELIFNKN